MRHFYAFVISSFHKFDNDHCLKIFLISSSNTCQKVKEWLHHIGIGEQTAVTQDDDEDDGALPIYNEDSIRNRCQHVSV